MTISSGAMETEKVASGPTVMSAPRTKKDVALVRHTARGVPGPGRPPESTKVAVCALGGSGCEQRPAESVSSTSVNAPRSGRTSVA